MWKELSELQILTLFRSVSFGVGLDFLMVISLLLFLFCSCFLPFLIAVCVKSVISRLITGFFESGVGFFLSPIWKERGGGWKQSILCANEQLHVWWMIKILYLFYWCLLSFVVPWGLNMALKYAYSCLKTWIDSLVLSYAAAIMALTSSDLEAGGILNIYQAKTFFFLFFSLFLSSHLQWGDKPEIFNSTSYTRK